MSQESSKVLTRQWKIIQFLLNNPANTYVSTANIEEHLTQQGLETTQRTIQRDLNLLEKLFPIESRRDCMPYNWRWKKIQSSVKGLNLTQALVLRLVSEELKDVLPRHMLSELEPLLEKARLVSSNAVMENNDKSLLDIFNHSAGQRGLIEPSILSQLVGGVSTKVNGLYRQTFKRDEKEIRQSLQQVATILESHAMPELAQILKSQPY